MEKRVELRAGGEIVIAVDDNGFISINGKAATKNEAVAVSRALLEAYHTASKGPRRG